MSYAQTAYTQTQQVVLRNVRRFLAGRDTAFTEAIAEASVLRALAENPSLVTADLLAGKASAIISLLSSTQIAAGEDKAFSVSGTFAKSTKATGSVVLSGIPAETGTITISDGVHSASVFEFDLGEYATGTLTFTGVPADTGTVSLSDGTTSKVFEFDTGTLGVASTGGVITLDTQPVDTDTVTLTTSTAAGSTATVFEFNGTGSVTGSNKPVLLGTSAATAATELIAAINATGFYSTNGSTGYTASSGGSGVVNVVRTATGAGNETITKSSSHITITSSFSGGVTQVAVGSAITGGRVGVATAATPGGTALSTAAVCTNLLNAINAVTAPAFLFTATQGAGTTVTLTANTKGTAGNSFTLTESATNFTVSGAGTFAGGAAAGSGSVTGSNIAVAIGATAALTATALHTAINAASSLDVTSANGTAGTCSLTTDAGGTTGNVTITKTATNCSTTGMSGGAGAATLTLLSDTAVGARTAFVTGFVAKVQGSNAWNEATAIVIEDTAGTDFFSIAKAALTANAELRPGTSSVTSAAAFYNGTGGGAGKGIQVTTTGATSEITGDDVKITVFGVLRNV